jgi:hypothetical protein
LSDSSNKKTRVAPPSRAAKRAWSAEMTAITRLLAQRRGLCERAVKQIRDVNESYLVVHAVMTNALSHATAVDHDLEPALRSALDARAARLKRLQAIV